MVLLSLAGSDCSGQSQLPLRVEALAGSVQAEVRLLRQEHRGHGSPFRGLVLVVGRQWQADVQMRKVPQVHKVHPSQAEQTLLQAGIYF